jgi:hypothetical protein
MPFRGPSLPERLLGGAVLLLLAAFALHRAVELVLSIIWPLLGVAALGLLGLVVWRMWRAHNDVW